MNKLHVVTGAFGFAGKYIARELLARGASVRTLISHPGRRDPFDGRVEVARLAFDDPAALAGSLRGATTLYNTYWVRFPRRRTTFDTAVANTRILVNAAREAGVRRLVHLSVTNPNEQSPLPYFHGKAQLEEEIILSGLGYAIVRPALIFGVEDILINNIAWLLRRWPVFAIPGSGRYRVQPVFAADLATIAVDAGSSTQDMILDAIGPEIYTYDELVRLIADTIDSRARLVHLPPAVVWLAAKVLGLSTRDVLLTWGEIRGLMLDLLISEQTPNARTSFSSWLKLNRLTLGMHYASELRRHYR